MPPPTKRRKTVPTAVEEITFDPSARQEYLTGFHKRKLERAKHARELAEKQAKLEKLEARKQLRDERKADLERHVAEVNALLEPAEEVIGSDSDGESDNAEEWDGVKEVPPIDHEAEYIDEDKYTTVTVEAMDLSKEGLHRVEQEGRKQEEDGPEVEEEDTKAQDVPKLKKRPWTKEKPKDRPDRPKQKKKKFRYESKSERKFTRMKQGARNSREAKARREK